MSYQLNSFNKYEIENNSMLSKFRTILIISMISVSFLSVVFAQEIEKIFVFYTVVYKDDRVEFVDFNATKGIPDTFYEYPSDYNLKIISVKNEILFQTPLQISFIAYPQIEDQPGVVELNEVTLYLRLPYFPDADRIELYHNNILIFDFDVKEYICQRDGICSEYENYLNCPLDCPLNEKDGYCLAEQDGICDPDCHEKEDPDCGFQLIWIFIPLIIAIFLFYLYHKRSEEKRAEGILGKVRR